MGEQGNYRLVGLTLMLGKIIEQIIKWLTCEHLKNNALINRSQHRDFVFKNKSCQTKLNSFFDIVTSVVDHGNAVNIVYLGFSKHLAVSFMIS